VSYRFELPVAGYYFVTVGTTNPWDTRNINICLEGVNMSGDYSIPKNTKVEVTYRVYVDDGQLDVDIKGPSSGPYSQYNDPMVGFIAVQSAIPISYLQSQILTLSTEISRKKEDNSDYYTTLSINEANAVISEAQAFVDSFDPETDDITSEEVQLEIKDKLIKLKTAAANLVPDIPNTVINPGQLMRDTNGAVIDAHGAGIMYDEITNKYYWYGEYHAGTWPGSGVRCYSSTDLLNWKDEGMALTMIASMDQFTSDPVISNLYAGRTDTDDIFDDIRVGRIIERPKVIYNDTTKKYVMWMHLEGSTNEDGTLNQSYAKAEAGCAISDSPAGPFVFQASYRMDQCPPDQTDYHPESKGYARDMNLFKDDDGSAYIIYASEENYTLYISKLTPDYTDITGWHKDGNVDENGKPVRDTSYKAVYGVDYVRVFPGEHREAPAMFKYDGKYYLLTSGATGWSPNENKYAVADNIFGPWSTPVNPFVRTLDTDPDPMKAFNTQTTCVIPVDPANGKFIYVGDMWNGGNFANDGAKYVFLPIEFGQGSDMIIRWYDSWDLSILDSMAKVNIKTKFPEAVALGTLPNLPATVDVLDKGAAVSTPAIWTVNSHTPAAADFSTPGPVTLQLTLPNYNNKAVYVKIYVIPDKTIFFVNCGGYVTSDYSLLTSYMQNTLINKGIPDQAYNAGDQSPWGYIGADTLPSGSDSGDIFTTLRYLNGGNSSSYPKGTDLSYQFTLNNGSYDVYLGFNDPWTNLSRKADLVINGEVKGPITFTPSNVQVHKGIAVTNNSLNITVRNTAAQDPLLSWIMIVDNDLISSPDPSMGLTASSPSPTAVNLTWHKILGATGYTLYRSDSADGTYAPIYNGSAGMFTDTNLQPNRTYYYKVSSTSDSGVESALSAAQSVITKSDVPTSLAAYPVKTAGGNGVTCAAIKWDHIEGASQYVLSRSSSLDGAYSEVYRGYAITCMDTGLKPGTTYYYKVKAVTSAGESENSTAASVKIPIIGKDAVIVVNGEAGANDATKLKLTAIKAGDKYYRYNYNSEDGKFVSWTCSSSTDLINWTEENVILTASSVPDLASCKFESVNIIYNEKTKRYVMWAHYENAVDYTLGRVIVAVSESDSPSSEFTVVGGGSFRPLGNDSRDISIFKDDDGSAYLISATNTNADLAIYKLTDDYLGIEKLVCKPYKGLYREAPGMVKIDGVYYLFTSAAAGWYPSQAMYSTATSMEGPWSEPKPIGNSSTFSGQSNAIITVKGTETTSYFAVVYRWLRGDSLWLPVIFDGTHASYDYCDSFLLDAGTGQVVPITNGILLSAGKPARASKSAAGYGPEKANDGDYFTAWQSERNYDWPQWWEVDLGAVYDLTNVQISWWILKGSEGYYKYTVQTKKDVNDTYTTVLDRTDNQFYGFTSDNITGQARYVRINLMDAVIQNNPDNNWYTPQLMEVKVFGNPKETSEGGSGNGPIPYIPVVSTPVPVIDEAANAAKIVVEPVLDTATNVAKAVVADADIAQAFAIAPKTDDGKKAVQLEIPKVEGAKAYEQQLPAAILASTDNTKVIRIKTDLGTVAVPANMFSPADLGTAKNVSIRIAAADASAIVTDATVKSQIGGRPVIEISVKADDKTIAFNNADKKVTVYIPYAPADNEAKDADHLVILYIDDNGAAAPVPSGKYDPAKGAMVFTTTSFSKYGSKYAVAQVYKTFDDIKGVAWAKAQIEALASRGIINGTSETTYSPNENITRADFIKLLVSTLNLTAEFDSNFDDVKPTDYYYNYVGIAKELGIANGAGNNRFDPHAKISRQDMMTLTARAMLIANKLKMDGTASDIKNYADTSKISSYAVDSIATLVKNGIITGDGKNIEPLRNTTRAEVAVILYRIYKK